MVERIWSARAATRDRADAYAAYFRRVVLPDAPPLSIRLPAGGVTMPG